MLTELTLPSGGVRQGDTLTILQLARHPHPAHTSTSQRWTHAHGGRLSSCAPLQEWCVDATKVRVTTCPGVWWTLERKQDSVHSDRSRDTFFWWNPSPGGHTGDISWQATSIYRHGHISPDIGWDFLIKKADNVSKILKYQHPLYFALELTIKQNISNWFIKLIHWFLWDMTFIARIFMTNFENLLNYRKHSRCWIMTTKYQINYVMMFTNTSD